MDSKPLPQRKSPRWQDYDYSQSGVYFVTICTYQRQHLFGQVIDGEMILNELGEIARWHWDDLPTHFPQVELDVFVVMPNHIHGIVVLTNDTTSGSKHLPALGVMVGTYKAAVTRHANRDFPDEPNTIWQSRYHDHVIRSEKALNQIRAYVIENPVRWGEDTYFG